MTRHWLNRPIPRRAHPATALDYGSVPIDAADPRHAERLVDLAAYGIAGRGYYARTDGLNAPYYKPFPSASTTVRCRRSVAERLTTVNASLAPFDVELFVLDGFRPIALQSDLWRHFLDEARIHLDAPSDEDCIAYAGQFCSDPRRFAESDPHTWPVHVTGGAVDLTLRLRGSGEALHMGSIFDESSDLSQTAHFENGDFSQQGTKEERSDSDRAALVNRRLLYWAMTDAGFANYPFEWWHYDWGTQLWAVDAAPQRPGGPPTRSAWYGPAASP